ncbi:MAG TPA: asparaginase [Gemmatimonadales bacterium]|jgi:L-asparaginase|nr:asparaginase [Gemmatimonadales bacterium]
MIHLLFTGGTISMQRDPAAGGNVPTHGGETLVGFAPGLQRLGEYRVENWAKLPACHLGPDRLWALRERVRAVAESGEVKGIVVTHGTDTIEETAYLLGRTLDPRIPVAITGAMRTSSDAGWDGPRNLTDAATVAASPASQGRGAMVVFNGEVFSGVTAVKTHATDLAAFSAPHAGPIGRVAGGTVTYHAPVPPKLPPPTPRNGLSADVGLVPVVVGDDGRMLDHARPHQAGVVVVAFGAGNVPPGAVPAMSRWLDEGKPVVLASRCPFGEVIPVYAFDGGGARTVAMGVIPAGPRTPSQARMELTIALSAGVPYGM